MARFKLTPMEFMRKYCKHNPNPQARGSFGYMRPLNERNPVYAKAKVVKGKKAKPRSNVGVA